MNTQDTNVLDPGAGAEAPPPGRIPLRRSTTDRVVGGVSAGIARRFGVDPVILRVAFVVGILLAGLGALVYLALWLLLPDDTDTSAEVLTRSPVPLIAGVIVAMVAVGTALHWIVTLGELPGVVVAGFLIGLGIWLYSRRGYVPAMAADAGPPAPPVGYAFGGTGTAAGTVAAEPGHGAAPQGPPPPREPRSYLGLVTMFGALIVAGLIGIADVVGLVDVSAVTFMAILLGVLAAGLLVGAFAGRARWLILPAALLALVMAATAQISSVLPGAFSNGVGERYWTPVTAGATYTLGLGQGTLDLSTWAGTPGARQPSGADTVTAKLTAGELHVVAPDTWDVVVDARVGTGDITVDGRAVDQPAIDARWQQTLPAVGTATGTIRLVLEVQGGTIRIDRTHVVVPEPAAPSGPAATADERGTERNAADAKGSAR